MRQYSSVNRGRGGSGRSSRRGNTSSRPRNNNSYSRNYGSYYAGRNMPGGYSRPSGVSSRGRRGFDKKLLLLIGIIAAAVVVIILLAVGVGAPTEPVEEPPAEEIPVVQGIIADNVRIDGVDVGGMDFEQAVNALSDRSKELTDQAVLEIKVPNGGTIDESEESFDSSDELSSDFTVDEETSLTSEDGLYQVIKYKADRSGIYPDVNTAVTEAIEYSDGIADKSEEEKASMPQYDIAIAYALDLNKLSASIAADAEIWNIPAEAATFGLEPKSDENDLTTSAETTRGEPKDGLALKTDELIQQIKERVETQNFEGVIEAPVEVTQPDAGSVDASQYEIIGEYSTSFSGSNKNRMYNIWKISSILNGRRISPGDTMSVNDIVGPRTEGKGWKLASGIENGQFTDQAGGGICQVSTTMYIAALKSELKIVERKHHTIPSTYVPLGLDATISTGSPDLKLENNTDYPVYVGIFCDVPDRTVRVRFYGIRPRDYTLKFKSNVIETIPAGETKYVADKSVPEGKTVVEGATRDGYKVEVFKVWYDKDSGDEIERKRIYTDTYRAFTKTVKYNPATPPSEIAPPEETVEPVDPQEGGEEQGGEQQGGEEQGGEQQGGEQQGGEQQGGEQQGGEQQGGEQQKEDDKKQEDKQQDNKKEDGKKATE